MTSDKELKETAEKIAEEKKGFYIHFAIYIIVNIFIIAQWWYITGGDEFPWFITTLFGWGIGIVAHYIVAFTKIKKYKKKEI